MASLTSQTSPSSVASRMALWLAHACILAFGLFFFLDNKADVDLWGNVGFVRELPWQEGFHYQNTFSYTEPDTPWINHEWLSEWLLWQLHQYTGNTGLLAYKLLVGCVLLVWMNRAMCRQGCGAAVRFFLLLLILSTIGYGFGVRPHLGTYVLMALMIALIRGGFLQRLSSLPLLLLLGAFWANWHGAFFIGLILLSLNLLVGCWRSSCRERVMSVAGLLAFFLGTLCNPHGLDLWAFVFSSASIVRPFLSEWAPLSLNEAVGVHIDFVLLAVLLTVSVMVSRKRDPLDIALLLVTLVAGVAMRRNIPLFALVAGLVGGRYVEEWAGSTLTPLVARFPVVLRCALSGLGMVFGLWATLNFNKTQPFEIEVDASRFPLGAMAFIKDNEIHGNAIVFFDWAEQFIWHRQTTSRVFLDGRFCSAYTRQTMDDYQRFIYGLEGWEAAIRSYPSDMALIHQGNPATPLMRQEKDWTVAYEDALCVLFLKTSIHSVFLEKQAEIPSTASQSDGTAALFP